MALFASSENLKNERPNYTYGDVWCLKCNCACEFDLTGQHRLGACDGSGYILIRAYCHGEHADVRITFGAATLNKGKKIEVFAPQAQEPLPPPPLQLPEKSSS